MTQEETERLKQLASEYKRKIEDKRTREADDLETLNFVKSEGPAAWAELRRTIKNSVDILNREIDGKTISWDEPNSDHIAITRVEGNIRLEGGFDIELHAAFFRCPEAKIDMRLVLVVDRDKVEFAPVDSSMTITGVIPRPEDVAYGLVRDLLNC